MIVKISANNDKTFLFEKNGKVQKRIRNYNARESTGGYVRVEEAGSEASDLFAPLKFDQIEVDGVVHATVEDCVSALNEILFNKAGSATVPIITTFTDNGDGTFTYTSEDGTQTTTFKDVIPITTIIPIAERIPNQLYDLTVEDLPALTGLYYCDSNKDFIYYPNTIVNPITEIDGGFATAVYLPVQNINGGNAQ